MVMLGRMFSWRNALVNVKPDTFLRWHSKGFRSPLAPEITTCGQTSNPQGSAQTHTGDGRGESHLGRGTDRSQIVYRSELPCLDTDSLN